MAAPSKDQAVNADLSLTQEMIDRIEWVLWLEGEPYDPAENPWNCLRGRKLGTPRTKNKNVSVSNPKEDTRRG